MEDREAPPIGHVSVRRIERLPGIELWKYHVRAFSTYSVLAPAYMIGGPDNASIRAVAWIRGQRQEVFGGSKMLLEPNEVCRVDGTTSGVPGHVTARAMLFNPVVLQQYFSSDWPGSFRFGQWKLQARCFDEAFRRATLAMEAHHVDDVEREHCIRVLLHSAFKLAGDRPVKRIAKGCERAVQQTLAILQDCYFKSLTLSELAAHVGISVYHLEHSFASSVGLPIHRMLQHIRVQRAMEMLNRGIPLNDVWCRCGFSDQAHMTRTFRRLVNFTPGYYVRSGNGCVA